MQKHISSRESGAISGAALASIILLVLLLAIGSFAIWAFVNYRDYKNNVDKKVSTAVAAAKKEQQEQDEKEFIEREKSPFRMFKGSQDFGSVEFQYPKTWSAYVVSDTGDYEVAFNPIIVPVQNDRDASQPIPLRLKVASEAYTEVIGEYQEAAEEGKLKSTPIEINGQRGNRIEGQLSEGISGVMVVFKVRDKTLSLAAESDSFKKDFDEIILKTLRFNP